MVLAEHEIEGLIHVVTNVVDIISLYYAFIFNLILWSGTWLISLGSDANPIAPIALALLFVLFFPRSLLVWLHNHDHLAALPLYPYSLIGGAVVLSCLPWAYIVWPAIQKNGKRIAEENEASAAHREALGSEGGVCTESSAMDGGGGEMRRRAGH